MRFLMLSVLLAAAVQANPVASVAPVIWNELDGAHNVTFGCLACGTAFPAGTLHTGIFGLDGRDGLAMTNFSPGEYAVSFASEDFLYVNDGFYFDPVGHDFPALGGAIDFWLRLMPAEDEEEMLDVCLFRITDGEMSYSLSICEQTEQGGSGFILELGNGWRAVSSTLAGTGLDELFSEDGDTGWHHIAVNWNNEYSGDYLLAVDGQLLPMTLTASGGAFPYFIQGDLNLLRFESGVEWLAMDLLRVWGNFVTWGPFDPEQMMGQFGDGLPYLFSCEYVTPPIVIAEADPNSFSLPQNVPNPFNPSTTISFTLERQDQVELSVYNLQGELVRNVIRGVMDSGEHELVFDARDLPSGVYFYRLVTQENGVQTRSMTLVK